MRFVILTGMSGAGKSTALKMLEDAGYFCVDNLPISLISKFAELSFQQGNEVNKVAISVDIRSGQTLEEVESVLEKMKQSGYNSEILYLDASDDILVKRYKETRRNHPLAGDERVETGILKERSRLDFLKKKADYIIDTSYLLTRELKKEIDDIFVKDKEYKNIYVRILSFGFKYGIPTDADLVFDVRFLPNPFYIEHLKNLSGNDKEVQDFCMSFDAAKEFLVKLEDMVNFLIPHYIAEGKNQLIIGIGCTGGRHRSVTLANHLFEKLSVEKGFGLKIEHRDIHRDQHRKNK